MYGVLWFEYFYYRYSIDYMSMVGSFCEISLGCMIGMEVVDADLGLG